MRKATLTRTETGDDGTFGIFTTGAVFECCTLELPWRDNAHDKSCIPAGVYLFKRAESPKHGPCYEAQDVPGRTHIQIHGANWAGDTDNGKKSQLLGCIAPGRAIGDIAGQRGVMSSKDALAALEAELEKEPFELTIRWAAGIGPGGA